MKKKGQALVEFVIILPIFIMLLLAVIDLGTIFYSKISLESKMSDVIDSYQSGKSQEEITKLFNFTKKDNLKILEEEDYLTFFLTKQIDIITPGLQLIFDSPYKIEVKRSILNE